MRTKNNHANVKTMLNRKTKLTDADIVAIQALKGKMKQQAIAERYGITQGYVSAIFRNNLRRKSY